jgi:hypothetical protein
MTLIGISCLKSADTNNDFWYRLATVDTKKTSFFVSYKWYRPGRLIPKIPYQSILQTYYVVVWLKSQNPNHLLGYDAGFGLGPRELGSRTNKSPPRAVLKLFHRSRSQTSNVPAIYRSHARTTHLLPTWPPATGIRAPARGNHICTRWYEMFVKTKILKTRRRIK